MNEKLETWFSESRGRRAAVSKALEITMGAISQWKSVPPKHAIRLEQITGISRHDLCPDIFGAQRLSSRQNHHHQR